jgi:membrane associated rhomboid family serine protease
MRLLEYLQSTVKQKQHSSARLRGEKGRTMVLPLYDDNSDRRIIPYVNYSLIAINVFVFVVLQNMGADNSWFTQAFSTVPVEIVTGQGIDGVVTITNPVTGDQVGEIVLQKPPVPVYFTLLTSMFMHGGWAHLLGNMLFLWIFGDNVEDYLGSLKYLFFYLLCGVLASLAHVGVTYATGADPRIPCLGASGAISGVLGAYLILFPQKQVTVILFRFLTQVPAYVAIGMWFVLQIIQSLGALGGEKGGGVAYGAHIGGFIAGMVLVKAVAVSFGQRPDQPRQWNP